MIGGVLGEPFINRFGDAGEFGIVVIMDNDYACGCHFVFDKMKRIFDGLV